MRACARCTHSENGHSGPGTACACWSPSPDIPGELTRCGCYAFQAAPADGLASFLAKDVTGGPSAIVVSPAVVERVADLLAVETTGEEVPLAGTSAPVRNGKWWPCCSYCHQTWCSDREVPVTALCVDGGPGECRSEEEVLSGATVQAQPAKPEKKSRKPRGKKIDPAAPPRVMTAMVESAREGIVVAACAAPVRAVGNDYETFLASKVAAAQAHGFDPGPMSERLFPFQRAIVTWALKLGRCAIFADTGLGKTAVQVTWAAQVAAKTGKPVLILAPLAVGAQTIREGEKFGVAVTAVRDMSDPHGPVNVANYEILHKLDPSAYSGIVLDESSVLKCFSGKTKQALVAAFARTPYRLACTATPAPNDPMELGNHSEFIGVMSSHKMLARWFVNDTTQAGVWRLKGHAAKDYWRWVTSWAVCCALPSDIGGDDTGYVLPALAIEQHAVDVDIVAGREPGSLFRDPSLSATSLHKELRRTAGPRASKVAELVAGQPAEQWIVWCHTNYEADALAALIPGSVDVRGDMTLAAKESAVADFLSGKTRVLISKASILGFGLNLQNCARMAFVGLSYSFEQFYQSIRRSWRFGQAREVQAHIVAAATEGAIADTVKRKAEEHDRMKVAMVAAMRGRGLVIGARTETALDYVGHTAGGMGWEVRLGDCVDLVRQVPDESAGLIVYSPPFSNLYTYSDSYRDMGNSADDAEFFRHYAFLLGELRRVSKTGRLMAVHVKQCVNYIGRDGASGLRDFRGDVIRACQAAGWVYHSEVCIWKCPVTEMQRTKSHGLLYKQLRRDSTFSRQGLAEYVCVFRKWAPVGDESIAEIPVTKTEYSFPLDLWQRYASPVWTDIDQTNVLNVQAARENADEKHIAPLQLDVIERCVQLWSNPGDLVLDPFSGVGSTGVVAVDLGRTYLGFELKPSYFTQSVRNLSVPKQMNLLGAALEPDYA